MDKKSTWFKVLVPVLIILVIGGLWFVKNQPAPQADALPQSTSAPEATALPEDSTPKDTTSQSEAPVDANFALDETAVVDFAALAAYGLPAIVDYGSDSCIPCQQMAPVLKTLNAEFAGKAFIKFVDVWKYGEAAANVPVQVIPTQVIFNADGTPFTPSKALAEQIAFTMYSSKDSGEHIFTVHQGGLTEAQMRTILKEMGVE